MDPVLQARLDALEKKIDATYASAEKTRKYLMWTGIVTVVVLVLPLLALPFVAMQAISSYSELTGLLQ